MIASKRAQAGEEVSFRSCGKRWGELRRHHGCLPQNELSYWYQNSFQNSDTNAEQVIFASTTLFKEFARWDVGAAVIFRLRSAQ